MHPSGISESALSLNQSGRRPDAPPQRLQALLFLHDNLASVCAWCADKAEVEDWCHAQGHEVTHTICPTCQAHIKDELNRRPQLAAAP